MTRNGYRDAIGGAGVCYGAHGARCAYGVSDLGIACSGTGRDAAERLPYAVLKNCPADVEGKIETSFGVLDESDHLGNKPTIILPGLDQAGAGKLALKLGSKGMSAVPQQNRADALGA